jgi:RNA polymerase sigma-70 factor (family 1)
MNINNLSDQELWVHVTTDNSSAFVVLYNRYWNRLFKSASFHLKDSSLAEEVVHDVFVVLWNRRKFLVVHSFEKYIQVTARYHVLKKLKSLKSSIIDYIEDYAEHRTPVNFSTTTEKIKQEDFETELKTYLKGLPKRCAEIFVLSRVNHLTNKEIAESFGISKFTVENQITYALKYLRTQITHKPIDL